VSRRAVGTLDEGVSIALGAPGGARPWRRFRRRATGVAGAVITLLFVALAAAAPWIAPHDPTAQELGARLASPDASHWLGRDEFGRDLLSRVVWGARLSLLIGAASVALAVATGVPLGLVAGYVGGRLDGALMRVVDVLLAFPGILLALAVVAVVGDGSAGTLILAIGVFAMPTFARLARASALALRDAEFVEAIRALGAGGGRVLWRHVLPNALGPLIVQATLGIAGAILTASALSFLGVGVQPPAPEWGAMISDGRAFLRPAPQLVAWPGLALTLVTYALNALGDTLRDVLDPRGE
jgi:ABC-type dipeptide/oligopeptide/nickel transport system permease subunit